MATPRVLAALKRGLTGSAAFLRELRRLVRRAIREQLKIRVKYDGRTRTVEPHQLVFETDGLGWLDIYDEDGEDSPWLFASGRVNGGWLRFSLARIESIELLDERFRVRAGFNPGKPKSGRVEAVVHKRR